MAGSNSCTVISLFLPQGLLKIIFYSKQAPPLVTHLKFLRCTSKFVHCLAQNTGREERKKMPDT
jgi:hypothetical protein